MRKFLFTRPVAMLKGICGIACTSIGLGCNLLDTPTIPEGTMSPSTYHSKAGGLALGTQATWIFRNSMIESILDGGTLTDELNRDQTAETPSAKGFDERYIPEVQNTNVGQYTALQKLRGQAAMARTILAQYGSDLSPAVRGRLFALEGYAVLLLADQYCAGVPLSTLDFDGDYTYRPSLSIEATYEQAAALFDSAFAISNDSAGLLTLSTIGKARALVGAGRLADAAKITPGVMTTDAYRMRMSFIDVPYNENRFAKRATVSDQEGWNGLPYRSSNDPRSKSDTATLRPRITDNSNARLLYFPRKYAGADSFNVVLASGIEARLIEAEYQLSLHNTSQWLTILNDLRTDGTINRIDTLVDETVDTVWNSGSGGVASLAPLRDPGTAEARLTLMFDERAYWLFLTGNRLPDLRRLVRQYGRDREQVFPTGLYGSGTSIYGEYQSDINLPIPWDERRNPLFRGCINRDQ